MIFFIDLESSALFAALSFDSPALIFFDLSDAVALLFNLLFNHNNASNHDSNDEQGNNLGCIFFHFIRKFFRKKYFWSKHIEHSRSRFVEYDSSVYKWNGGDPVSACRNDLADERGLINKKQ